MALNFDNQAAEYDSRAGLTKGVPEQIAKTIEQLAPAPINGLLLEVGAGTGQIGYCLQRLLWQYVGFDISPRMLAHFRGRFTADEEAPSLVEADGNQAWPVADRSAGVVFSSRTLHLLDRDHVVNEVFRVATGRGTVLVTGHVERSPESVPAVMRRQMRRLLREQGYQGRSGSDSRRAIFEACQARGAEPIAPVVAARWSVDTSPLQSIRSWENKPSLAGNDVPAAVKEKVLSDLRAWATKCYNGLHQTVATDEAYVLEGARLAPHHH